VLAVHPFSKGYLAQGSFERLERGGLRWAEHWLGVITVIASPLPLFFFPFTF
jgi:hypothetical protein